MAICIRLSRGGAKKRPFYKIVVADVRSPRDGRYVERLGYFNPIASGQETGLSIDMARVEYWLAQGAKPSDRVSTLIKTFKRFPTQEEQKQQREAKYEAAKAKREKLKMQAKAEADAKAKAEAEADSASSEAAAGDNA